MGNSLVFASGESWEETILSFFDPEGGTQWALQIVFCFRTIEIFDKDGLISPIPCALPFP